MFATGGIASSIATSGASLLAISSVSVLIQAYMKHKNIEIKLYQCQYAFKTYGHLLNEIKEIMRNGHFDRDDLTKGLLKMMISFWIIHRLSINGVTNMIKNIRYSLMFD